ncbi:MAG TPA: BlaI/MecI/CopY family transcriptional regulator [Thermoanaerobaculia bacterium]|jgi:predicted transcriptional regulator|nr:BlaI/MecI/CopY family transcriptional regulator [Thermoanaerobaculia bacterium]
MPRPPKEGFSRRERQIMDIVYNLRQATAADVHERLADPPTYTAVRGLLRVLVDKGHLAVERDGSHYVYRPTMPREAAGASLLAQVIHNFFDGSAAQAMAALVGSPNSRLSAAELERLEEIVKEARGAEEGS